MRFSFEGEKFRIWFRYQQIEGCRGVLATIEKKEPGGNAPEWATVATGWSKCMPQDSFCKETGRKNALTRAVQMAI